MNRPPYRSEAKNIFGETVTTTVPAVLGNECVLISQTGQHQVQDTISTHISTMAQYPAAYCPGNGQMLNATPMNIPGGVSFTFADTGNHQYYCPPSGLTQYMPQQQISAPQPVSQFDPSRLQYEIALKQLEQQVLENMLAQTQRREKSYQLMFHQNEGTSTSDLNPKIDQKSCGMSTQTDDVEMNDSYRCEQCKSCDNDHHCCCITDSEDDDEFDCYPRRFSSLVLNRKNSPPPENFYTLQQTASQLRSNSNNSVKLPIRMEDFDNTFNIKPCAAMSKRITFAEIAEEIPDVGLVDTASISEDHVSH